MSLVELVRWCIAQEPAENLVVTVDKHGGRTSTARSCRRFRRMPG